MVTLEASQLNAWMTAQDIQSAVVRPVVEENVSFDQRIVMPKEEAEHLHFVPRERVKMNTHCNGRYSLLERNYRIFRELNSGSIDCAQYSAPQCRFWVLAVSKRSDVQGERSARGGNPRSSSGFDYARIAERLDTHDVHDAGQIVGKNVQRHLGGDLWQRLHQEVGCSHPGLDRAEAMLDRLPSLAHFLRVLIEAALHRLENVLMLPSLDPSLVALGAVVLGRDCRGGRRRRAGTGGANAAAVRPREAEACLNVRPDSGDGSGGPGGSGRGSGGRVGAEWWPTRRDCLN